MQKKGSSFYLIADRNIKNTIKTAVTSANRKKHEVLNQSVMLYYPNFNRQDDEEYGEISQYLPRRYEDPYDVILEKEAIENIDLVLKESLSTLEYEVMALCTLGYKQHEIASQFEVSAKVVDNAMQRARKKLTNHFRNCEDTMGTTQQFKISVGR